MQLSQKEKKKRQHTKELHSLRNRMGSNIVWFDSLTTQRKYDLLFLWKQHKKINKGSFKYFLKEQKNQFKFKPKVQNIRQATIDFLLNSK